MESYRLAKFIARSGQASRREAEQWIRDGRVTVNGDRAETLGIQVTVEDSVKVDGEKLRLPKTRLWMFHKPRGVLTTHRDPQKRKTLLSVLPKSFHTLKPIGRLDMNTEGLLLLTNDGDLARQLEHPDQAVTRVYRVRVFGTLQPSRLKLLEKGWRYKGMRYRPMKIEVQKSTKHNHWLFISLQEGKYREVRLAMEYCGLKVDRLIRMQYGPFLLGDLPQGGIMEVPAESINAWKSYENHCRKP